MPDFRVYYADGSTYDGPVESVPIFEVLVIVERDADHGRRLVSGGDFYVWDDGKWLACDQFTMFQYLARPGLNKRVLIGVMVHGDRWNEIARRARYDPDFPDQTGYHVYERKVI